MFKDATAGRIAFNAALREVKKARRKADDVRRLLRALGDTEEHRSLSERFRRTQQRMEAGRVDATTADTFAELSVAMHTFELLAYEKLHTRADAA